MTDFTLDDEILYFARRRFREAMFPPLFRDCTFDNFETPGNSHKAAKELVEGWVSGFDGATGLILCGVTGAGKTHLACAALRTLIERGRQGRYVNVPEMFGAIKRAWDKEDDEGAAQEELERAMEVEILLMDDLGVEKPSDWLREQIYVLVNHRYVNRAPVIGTSNLLPEEFVEAYGERVWSRLQHMCLVVPLRIRQDWRIRKGREGA